MCELLGFTGPEPAALSDQLTVFYAHSTEHPHGWGLAAADGAAMRLNKEPVRAVDSLYLKKLLARGVETDTALAHIRLATVGNVEWRNCHPYTARDLSGRRWTLVHNGTIFRFPPMDPFYAYTDSDTDSACFLTYLISRINQAARARGGPLDAPARFALLEEIIFELAFGNKINLLIFDGELFYVHTNYTGTLHRRPYAGGTLFSTRPLEETGWEPVPMTRLLAYQAGALRFTGRSHGKIYHDDPEHTKLLYLSYAAL